MRKVLTSAVALLTGTAAFVAFGVSPASAKTTVTNYFPNALTIQCPVGDTTVAPASGDTDTCTSGDSSAVAITYGGADFDNNFVPYVVTAFGKAGNDPSNNAGWFANAYADKNSLTGRELAIGYGGVGPTGGQGAIGFTDIPLGLDTQASPTDATMLSAESETASQLVQVPITLGGVAIIYNINFTADAPKLCAKKYAKHGLILSGENLGQIFNGVITTWDNAALLTTNADLEVNAGTSASPDNVNCLSYLTDESITDEVRTADSGTSYVLTTYLNDVDPTDFPAATSTMPVGVTNKGSAVLAPAVASTNGAIGYVESSYAAINKLQTARLINAAGDVVKLSNAGVLADATKALKSTGSIGSINNFSPTALADFSVANQDCRKCYPIAGFSWAIVQQQQNDASQAIAIAKFLEYLSHGSTGGSYGQSLANGLDYVPLPTAVQVYAQDQIQKITYGSDLPALSNNN